MSIYLPVSRNLPKSSLPNRHKNWIGQKRPKTPNLYWPFFKNEKKPKEFKKVKIYKFGLKKAKLATLLLRLVAANGAKVVFTSPTNENIVTKCGPIKQQPRLVPYAHAAAFTGNTALAMAEELPGATLCFFHCVQDLPCTAHNYPT